ncbi:hypothetical protein HC752_14885 [Vibrio sp. S9_S30]|uniref:hypothetical protein n=1 Tax=Vibrio sp. S9_S30 TaxID=2720226 RepID=UPI0016803241|nr:hypothetical protein [Vibrio sp. S9_S30]MBD1558221.1 hypothetical protein [Vibrio sp. S9_S30]
MISSQTPSLAHANSILYDSCARNSYASTSANCYREREAGDNHEGAIWESEESEESRFTFVEKGHSSTDNEWKAMDSEDKVLSEKGNDCVYRGTNDCNIYMTD